ncbi:hypothetical protein M1145_01715 [Patescibacteria group bacterium]|nr:hypothetical protein [Patescibacteria group bacterium]
MKDIKNSITKNSKIVSSFIENIQVINYIPKDQMKEDNEIKTILGIGGTHIYYGKVKNTKIIRENILPLPKVETFFKDIIDYGVKLSYFDKNTLKINCIFSYPFKSIEKDNFIDGFFEKLDYSGKKIPFEDTNFFVSEKLKQYINWKINFNILNDSVSTNLFNINKYRDYDMHISVISGTGVNVSFTKGIKIINSEIGRARILKDEITGKFVPIESMTSFNNICRLSKKYNIDKEILKERSAGIIASIVIGITNNTKNIKNVAIIAQGSFITKDEKYFQNLNILLSKYLKKDFIFYKDNKADIKGASLL